MGKVNMKLTTTELVREIRERSNGMIKTKDIQDTIKLLEEVIVDELKKGNSVKLRSLVNLKPVVKEESTSYDGLNKRYYTQPKRIRVSVKALGKLTNIPMDDESNE